MLQGAKTKGEASALAVGESEEPYTPNPKPKIGA